MNSSITQSIPTEHRIVRQREGQRKRGFVLVPIIVALFFVQIWFDVAGFTVRSEDLLILLVFGLGGIGILIRGRIRYRQSILNLPLILWLASLCFGVLITLISEYPAEAKRDAFVNGIRLNLAHTLFFLTYFHPAPAKTKAKALIWSVLLITIPTTIICLLQIGYWDGWLAIQLPSILTELAPRANNERGREIFGLYLGNTGTHIWSAMLSMQAVLIWLLARQHRKIILRGLLIGFFGILLFILIRMSVRSSILGLFIAIFGIELIASFQTRSLLRRGFLLIVVPSAAMLTLVALFTIAPDSYFVERIRQAIPSFTNGQLQISPASNLFGRFEYQLIALQMFAERPVFGLGFWSFPPQIIARTGLWAPDAHNSYIHALAEVGLIGIIAMVSLIGTMIGLLWHTRSLQSDHHDEAKLIWHWSVGALIFLLSTAMVANPFWEPTIMGSRMVLFGIIASMYFEQRRDS